MAESSLVRKVTPGWQAVLYLGCDTDRDGRPVEGTADRVIKWWAPTRRRALAILDENRSDYVEDETDTDETEA